MTKLLGLARITALALAAVDAGVGITALTRPERLRRMFNDSDSGNGHRAFGADTLMKADALYARWGVQLLAYAALNAAAAIRPSPGPLAAAATIRLIETPSDFYSGRHAPESLKRLFLLATAANTISAAVLLVATRQARRRRYLL